MNKTISKTVNVTQRDIDLGIAADCEMCPVARAMRRVFKDFNTISVTRYDSLAFAGSGPPRERYEAHHTDSVAVFINDFDNGREVQPFKFTVAFEHIPRFELVARFTEGP